MSKASKIIVVRADFSVPGSDDDNFVVGGGSGVETERRFFELAAREQPDVVVLDLTRETLQAISAIRAIRERARLPVLVVHRADDRLSADYRTSGAAGCLAAPIDLVLLNQTIHRIIATTANERKADRRPIELAFENFVFRPDQNSLDNSAGPSVRLTTLETDALKYLAMHSRKVCSRNEIAQVLYGKDRPTTDRAVDIVINRLRKKLSTAAGTDGQDVLKTQFRRGYILLTDVSVSAP